MMDTGYPRHSHSLYTHGCNYVLFLVYPYSIPMYTMFQNMRINDSKGTRTSTLSALELVIIAVNVRSHFPKEYKPQILSSERCTANV